MITVTINREDGTERHLRFDLLGNCSTPDPETSAEQLGIVLAALRQSEVLWYVSLIEQRSN